MEYNTLGDTTIFQTAQNMANMANKYKREVRTEFNGILLIAKPGDKPSSIIYAYEVVFAVKRVEYQKSGKIEEKQHKKQEAKNALAKALKSAPPMSFYNQTKWQEFGTGAIEKFAQDWARLIECRIAKGEIFESCATETVWFVADAYELSCSNFAQVLRKLFEVWTYGEQLRV